MKGARSRKVGWMQVRAQTDGVGAVILRWFCVASLAGCAGAREPGRSLNTQLETVPLVITEVAQGTAYDGTTGDKVEVFCTSAGGCSAFKVCDPTTSGTTSCSALQAP